MTDSQLPALKGTPKQISWAEDIRGRSLESLTHSDTFAQQFFPHLGVKTEEAEDARAEAWESVPSKLNLFGNLRTIQRIKTLEVWNQFVVYARNNDDAKFWIDMRGDWDQAIYYYQINVLKVPQYSR